MKGSSILLLATLASLLLATESAPVSPPASFDIHDTRPLLQKRQQRVPFPIAAPPAPDPPTKEPEPTAPPKTKPPGPSPPEPTRPEQPETTSVKPDPPTPPPPTHSPNPPPKPTADPPRSSDPVKPPAHSSSSNHKDSESSSLTATGTPSSPSGAAATPTSGGDEEGANGEGGVPTKVSEKVFIGLGTVGGLLVFALGGVAFCRHRRKKDLAAALLEQTAQFNNNNPYAKLDEPGMVVKESLPMTPTKPLGTFSVVTTYTPALADEIEVGIGDSVTILQEFDDGWCLGVNNSRGQIKGVFPSHCVDMGQYGYSEYDQQQQQYQMPNPSFKAQANKRMSSMAPARGWDNHGYQGQGTGGMYDHYPPAPTNHGHNNGYSNHGGDVGYYGQGGY